MRKTIKESLKKTAKVSQIPYWVLLVLFIVSASISIYALRQNNLNMVRLREAVYEADKSGGDVNGALNNLRRYVHGHMNTNLASGGNAIKPPIQLKYTYERLQTAEQQRVKGVNDKIYTEAQNYCQTQNPQGFSGGVRVPCVQEYVTRHGVKSNPIPPPLYQFDFVSPTWSPDLAGWSVVVSVILFVTLSGGFIANRLLRVQLQHQQL